jgi:hypothetical protein
MLHSAWALATGIAVIWLARERYHLVTWVVAFMALLWASTLFFGRYAAAADDGPPGLMAEVTSYVTRILYQETLFFLLPLYAYSTVVGSANVLFLSLLGGLALFSCMDLAFDRWLRTRPLFALAFFTVVTFAALNLVLPLVLGLRPRFSAPLAALLSVAAAVPLATRTMPTGWWARVQLVSVAAVMLAVPIGFPGTIPPVPLRLDRATFSTGIERGTLTQPDTLDARVSASTLHGPLVMLAQVFAPAKLPVNVRVEWWRDGEMLRLSRDIAITAHASGFRVWDSWRPRSGSIPAGRYKVVLRTGQRRVFGVARIRVVE